VVNGQSGKVEGERPWSWIKIALTAILVAAITAGVAYLVQIGQLQQR
jgi:hypothetical protein